MDMLSPKTTADLMEFTAARRVAKGLIDAWKAKLAPARIPVGYGAPIQMGAREGEIPEPPQ